MVTLLISAINNGKRNGAQVSAAAKYVFHLGIGATCLKPEIIAL